MVRRFCDSVMDFRPLFSLSKARRSDRGIIVAILSHWLRWRRATDEFCFCSFCGTISVLPRLDIEWSLTYVGSPDSTQDDQELDSVFIGPVAVGLNKFVFEAAAPNIHKLPSHEWLGTTIVLLQCSYRDQVFFRVGYFVKNDYTGDQLIEHPDSITAREARERKTSEKIRASLTSGDGWEDFEDFVRKREKKQRSGVYKEGEEEEDDEDDDKSVDEEEEEEEAEGDDLIVEDDEDDAPEEDEENEENGEDDDEDEEDEESDDERGPGGKRPPAGKQPPAGKTPPPSAVPAASAESASSLTAAIAESNGDAPAAHAASTDGAVAASEEVSHSSAPNTKKRARTENGADANGNGADGDAHKDQPAVEEDEPTAKRRKLAEHLDAYTASHYEEGPRWYTNVDPLLIRRTVVMDGPRVTLFTISWADDDM